MGRHRTRRWAALFLSAVLTFSQISTAVYAEAPEAGLCEHHPEHTAECGYTEGSKGTPCSHEHTEDCYTLVTKCVHEHTVDCYPEEGVSDNTATPSDAVDQEPTECTHECSEESGCITKELNCKHEHDEACGYTEGTPGSPCTYVCEICNPQDSGQPEDKPAGDECVCTEPCTEDNINEDCPVCGAEDTDLTACKGEAETSTPSTAIDPAVAKVQTLIDVLPPAESLDSMSAEERQAIYAQVDKAYDAYNRLTDEQQMAVGSDNVAKLLELTSSLTQNRAAYSNVYSGNGYTWDFNTGILTVTNNDGLQNAIDEVYHGQGQPSGMNLKQIAVGSGVTKITSSWYDALTGAPGLTGYSMDFSQATDLTEIESEALSVPFVMLGNVDLSNCINLTSIGDWAFPLGTTVDITGCVNLTNIGEGVQATSSSVWLTSLSVNGTPFDGFDRTGLNTVEIGDIAEETITLNAGVLNVFVFTGASITVSNGPEIVAQGEAGVNLTVPLEFGPNNLTLTVTWGDHSKSYSVQVNNTLERLPAPGGLTWDRTVPGKATWNAVENASGYSVQLYKDGFPQGEAVPVDGTSHTFTITEAGIYSFTVKAIAAEDSNQYADSEYIEVEDVLYTVFFDTAGGWPTIPMQLVHSDGKVSQPVTPTKTGYTFDGWYLDNGLNYPYDFDSNYITAATTLYAKWTANTYKVTLNANGGTIASGKDVTSYTYGVGAALPTAQDISREGHIFDGWYEKSDFSGDPVTEISAADTGAKTYYAKWLSTDAGVTAVSVNEKAGIIDGTTITVVLDYGTGTLPTDSNAVSITAADGATVSGLATTDGSEWTFTVTAEDGKTKKNYTIKVSIAPDPAIGNREDVNAAKSTIENYDWTVPQATANTEEAVKAWIEGQLAAMNLNGVSYTVTMTDDSFTAATEGGEANRYGTNGSFAFTVKLSKGENTGNVATSTYAEATVTISDGTITATPYTKWTVTVNTQGAGTASGGGTFESGSTVIVTATPNSSRDYFIRWTESGKEVSRDAAYSFVLTADRSLIAEFGTHNSSSGGGGGSTTYYTLTFETNGGSKIDTYRTSSYGKIVDLSGYAPTREGYDFNGWYSDAGLTNRITEIRLNGSKTVYAGWTKHNPGTGVDNPFTDVKESDWFYNDVMYVYHNDLMSGTSATTFSPNEAATRAQIAVIFYRMAGSPAVTGDSPFTDVENGPGTAWYYNAVLWAHQNGIVAGYGDGTYHPGDPVTREQLAVMFYNYANYKGYDLSATNDLTGFTDAGKISDWARPAMRWAVGSGLMNGYEDGTINPQGTATRAQLAAMLHNFIEKNNLVPVVPGGNGGTGGTGNGGGWTQHIPSPQTGDSSNIGLWFSLCVLSFAGLVGTTVAYAQTKRRREDEEALPQLI